MSSYARDIGNRKEKWLGLRMSALVVYTTGQCQCPGLTHICKL